MPGKGVELTPCQKWHPRCAGHEVVHGADQKPCVLPQPLRTRRHRRVDRPAIAIAIKPYEWLYTNVLQTSSLSLTLCAPPLLLAPAPRVVSVPVPVPSPSAVRYDPPPCPLGPPPIS
jgi:hypothetical protein